MTTARQIVYEMLLKMHKNDSFSNILLDNEFTAANLEARDKAFAAALFYGVLERRMTLDYIIRYYSKMQFDNIETETVQLLRMGLYQLLYLNSVPESAAVNESVDAAGVNAKGFVNGILRSFLRDNLVIDYKDLSGVARLSIEYSCPKWIIKKWTEQFGEATCIDILKASFGRPPLYARINPLNCNNVDTVIEMLRHDKISAQRSPLLENCIEIGNNQGIEKCTAYRKGMFHIQDISSQLCCEVVKPLAGETVFDMCAAPGGKSFTMAEMMMNKGKIYSYDLYDAKVTMIESGAKRLGINIITAEKNDARLFNERLPQADKVLCDVVCSGLGVIRRKPEIKYKPMKEIEKIPEMQRQILESSANYVKVGGTLVYSTCTINVNENERIVDEFLQNHHEFEPIIVPLGNNINVENQCCRTFLPNKIGGDGFFAATLRKVK